MSDEVEPGHVRVRLDLSYDGKDFSGWAKQPSGRRTVQGEIEDALRTVTRSSATYELTVAGRTDAGVHARGQVAHVDLPQDVWDEHREKLLKRLAGRLSRDVRIWRAAEAPAGFNARFSAVWRRYAYRVTDNPGGVDPLLRGHVLWHDWPLDVAAMNAAAAGLVGEHDFAAYCKKREGATTIRTLQQLRWERGPDGIITATVRADAFCHNMVRSLVGAMLFVGDGHRPVEWPAKVLGAGVRDSSVHVVRPHGLTLEEVGYPADELLAARSREARNRRTLPGSAGGSGGCC
ncbi:tRNA pseudouridine(38-40) synthase TruA [Streptomyces lunaelactis]|uniref:tRNA pseudouridine(38-40) synthase TruA n=1 Tax=Streptomyces lunaelactis TaxID=1535768 RepID=UPI001584D518|nr:tRNA pseudouridine(38-40) synthase TruA [Streptomyces lunaelactis]NUK08247.1 tRNA pseudouridine(38-40) synthase TruA [Streptomyces lunaelactis]NUK32580.1 tRNA pseudouridine(38-40) synthase TruA [Streptomyces lunaelactis]NUK41335.1 tRNA pseudouridine(38-40) synthase TruA [Streptomyces lunaelactis]NUK48983.1 tRNA pseudouridine(38-40) synthase TruA [Streptomyces lunaelactis]NUK55875.1 tRNA pseudouridine(38-40) synthase TruA [Streptomyces lunaelactis]